MSAATTTQNGNTSAAISFKNLNPENPNLPVGYPTGTAVTVKQKKATPSVTTETKPQATKLKSSVTVSSEGKGTTTLPQTSGASVPLIVVLIGLAGSSALSIPVIGKFVMTQ
ncbi:hypothetical protein IV87_GL001742 [Pediococcus ethanolidurans]|uniref:Uncharacterized protein n=1 Tax=Pediococcus ethanolidurans TaxID=319653 RepID=A0A0R2K0H6_9LACO|nr:hypothetical protein IV87_GL001742 [Pediococcus ethanolidurans]